MAKNTSILLARVLTPTLTTGLYAVTQKVAIPAAVPANDQVQLLTITQKGRLIGAHIKQLATAGVGTQLKLVRNRGGVLTDLTASTAAGAAAYASGGAIGPVDLEVDDIIEVAVTGAATVAVNVEVDITLQH